MVTHDRWAPFISDDECSFVVKQEFGPPTPGRLPDYPNRVGLSPDAAAGMLDALSLPPLPMSSPDLSRGDFTLPGEAGHEILASGHAIYSTLCLVRAVQPWVREHPDMQQQNFLMSFPVVATGAKTVITLLAGFYPEQFRVNFTASPRRWWQAHDRTTGREVPRTRWMADPKRGTVTITGTEPGHTYTVNFLAYRQWEEISMYNHLTNDWGDREHLAAVDPMQPATQRVLLAYLEQWLREHPATAVVRFTSMFYNFSWFWGADHTHRRDVYSDWGDYAMTVSPRALTLFEKKYGYRLTAEDFVNGGLYNCTHHAPTRRYRDYMEFVHDFVITFGRRCIDLVHRHGKKAYVFYDDHWIGVEPSSPRFAEFGFDGLIKCVFNAFEVRLCAHARGVATHELRLHPYLFPTGLKGEPTFKAGGNPTLDAKNFWIDARRGLVRAPIDRIGLGGYLSLVEPFPEFQDYIAGLAREFRLLKSFHAGGAPWTARGKVAVLTAWGDLRAWTCSGHFTPGVPLYDVLESLAGLALDVVFLSFDDLLTGGVPRGVKTIINCGGAGTAWSGGHHWDDPAVEAILTEFTRRGGGLIGVGEPSAWPQAGRYFRLARVLGLDRDRGEWVAHGKYKFDRPAAAVATHFITSDVPAGVDLHLGPEVDGIFVFDETTSVLAERAGSPRLTARVHGRGRTVYLSGFKFNPVNTRLLHRAIFWAGGQETAWGAWQTDNVRTEATWLPAVGKLVVINNAGEPQVARVTLGDGRTTRPVQLAAHDIAILDA
jgi:beta-D-galactosyl-(1->4)-L-rhamnose phosphorylase